MKTLITSLCLFITFTAVSAVPTEEGLLKNVNNAGIPGNLITIKMMVQGSGLTSAEADDSKADFYKFVISLENPNVISMLQVDYSNSQMLSSQIKDLKYIPDLLQAIKKEKSIEKGMFYSVLMMLSTNRPQGVEAFLEKSGAKIVQNKDVLNEDKLSLLRAYRTYLATNKGKGDASSPLNPSDPQNKAKIIELFRANTFERSKNIELVKIENEFFWKVDWKSVQAYFSNEERRFRKMEFASGDLPTKLEASDYIMLNGTNELPKNLQIRDSKGSVYKMQIIGLDTKANREKKLIERYEDAKKSAPQAKVENFSFLF